MTVYIEYVIIDNLVIDYLLLKATFAITGITVLRRRLFFLALLGAGVALVYPLLDAHKVISVAVKVLSGFLIVLLAVKYKTIKSYLINAAIFFSLTFLTGGGIIGIFNILGLNYSSEYSVALIIIPAYLLIKGLTEVIKFIYKKKNVAAFVYKTELTLGKKTITVNGFMDTGNGVYDGDNPAIICKKSVFDKLLDGSNLNCKIKMMQINTVSGGKRYPSVKLDKIKIYILDKVNIHNNVSLVIVGEKVGEEYDVILHPALMEEGNESKSVIKAEKVS